MKKSVVIWMLIFFIQGGIALAAAPRVEKLDADKDGKTDTWKYYDPQGHLSKSAHDSNGDGKPDQFKEMLKSRNLVLREYDRNFDAKIDKRSLVQWNPNKKVPSGMVNNRLQYLNIPGYDTLWTEEDNDFDGKVDAYREHGNKNPSTERIGKPIDSTVKA